MAGGPRGDRLRGVGRTPGRTYHAHSRFKLRGDHRGGPYSSPGIFVTWHFGAGLLIP